MEISQIDMIDLWGRLPVRMRDYVRHLIALPGTRSAGSNGDNIVFYGPANVISIFVHEVAHSLDSHAFSPDLLPFHCKLAGLVRLRNALSLKAPLTIDCYNLQLLHRGYKPTTEIRVFQILMPKHLKQK